MVNETVFCANGCGTEIPAATKGDFFGCCCWSCLEEQRSIREFERHINEPTPTPETPAIANPFGRRRGVI